jgi:hypothetical protein
MDHGSVKLKTKGAEKDYTIFIIYDGASHLLWATVTASKEDAEAQECVREWMDLYQCRPKSMVADQAFMSPSWLKFYSYHGIKPVSLGARTSWPNRAETAIRLFKRQLIILSKDCLDDPMLQSLKNMKIEHLFLFLKAKKVFARALASILFMYIF